MSVDWDRVRTIADAVLYEGYLLYPYRATSGKNRVRWQFGVLGPPQAEERGIGEDATMSTQLLVDPGPDAKLTFVVRFLQLQRRATQRQLPGGDFEPVAELSDGAQSWVSWDEAVEREVSFGPFDAPDLAVTQALPFTVEAGSSSETVGGGRLLRTRQELRGELSVVAEPVGMVTRLSLNLRNVGEPVTDKDAAIATSMIGAHVIATLDGGEFVSLLEPPEFAADAAARCHQHRCFPVLAGLPGEKGLMLVSPIILYDHPEVAEQSEGALYDSTEIDEILTLRVMTMTDEEKAQARATDPLAARIIDQCDSMSEEALLNLHGVLRNPHADKGFGMPGDFGTGGAGLIPEIPEGVDWWDPLADNAVRPDLDAVLVNGVRVSRGSRVRLRPSRRADAQDLFFADRVAIVTSIHADVDGEQHVGVVLEDDPGADLHDSYGRYLYFAPDEVEPLEKTLEERSPTWQ